MTGTHNSVDDDDNNKKREQVQVQVLTIYELIVSIFSPPEKPKHYQFSTVNFYATLTEPDLGEIKVTVQKERAKLRKFFGHASSYASYTRVVYELVRIGYNRDHLLLV
jgi:hypothetical protein